jgi:citrate synthase
MSEAVKPAAGLQGVVAAPSAICFIDGTAGRLVYRGYEITDLVGQVSFEETAYLLWDQKLPSAKELATFKQQLGEVMGLPPHVSALLQKLPTKTQPMDALRTACSALASLDADLESNDPAANRRKALRLTAQFGTIVAAFHRLRNKQDPVPPDPSLSIAANFLYMLNGKKPHETLAKVLDAALILHA